MPLRKALLEKSVQVLTEKAEDCLDLAKTQHQIADKQNQIADRQHETADNQLSTVDEQHDAADDQHEAAEQQHEAADRLKALGTKLNSDAVGVKRFQGRIPGKGGSGSV